MDGRRHLCTRAVGAPLSATEKSNTTGGTPAPTSAKSPRNTWPSETLKGRVVMVDPAQHLVVVKSPEGVPFDMRLTSSTRIQSGAQKVPLEELNLLMDKNVSVRFRPKRSGNVAITVQVNQQ
jgi:hypothetical protein